MGNMLTGGFMTLLLKCIFVLAGCLLIEKFSKEIGAYFGAEDAMSAGKDMAGQVGDLAMKGVGAAAMVASGGAGLAMKAGKMAGGIAGKIGGAAKGIGKGIANSGVAQSMKKAGGAFSDGKGLKFRDRLKAAGSSIAGDAKGALSKAHLGLQGIGYDSKTSRMESLLNKGVVAEDEFSAADAEYQAAREKYGDDDSFVKRLKSKRDKAHGKMTKAQGAFDKAGDKLDEYAEKHGGHEAHTERRAEDAKAAAARQERRDERAAKRTDARVKRQGERSKHALNTIGTIYGLGQEFKSKLPGMKYHSQIFIYFANLMNAL
jgi:hypothetical protein